MVAEVERRMESVRQEYDAKLAGFEHDVRQAHGQGHELGDQLKEAIQREEQLALELAKESERAEHLGRQISALREQEPEQADVQQELVKLQDENATLRSEVNKLARLRSGPDDSLPKE